MTTGCYRGPYVNFHKLAFCQIFQIPGTFGPPYDHMFGVITMDITMLYAWAYNLPGINIIMIRYDIF